jgi:NAD(P)H-hydrate epimerase
VQADLTLTLGLPKNCLYLPHARSLCGDIIVIPLGFPPPLLEDESLAGELLEASSYLTKLPEIPRTAYKTKRGHLAVFAGSERTSGAAWLCTHAAARSRVGLVTFFADSDIYANVVGSYSSVIVHKWDPKKPEEGSAKDLSRLENYSAFLAGPGWGFAEEKKSWLLKLLANDRPGVIDADALRMIAEMREKGGIKVGPNRILTPHPGEFSAFLKVNIKDMLENPLPPLRSLCRELDAHIILKGHVTYIMAPDGRYKILDGMNPAMATGGTGDVLSGIVAGLLGQGVPVFEAAQAGAMLHACLGKQLYKEKGWFIAEDLLPLISPAMASPLY